MGTYADPFRGETVAHSGDELALRLCELVGADPGRTTTITLEAVAGVGAVIRWGCIARVSLTDVSRVLAPDDPGPAPAPDQDWRANESTWRTPDDAGPAGGP